MTFSLLVRCSATELVERRLCTLFLLNEYVYANPPGALGRTVSSECGAARVIRQRSGTHCLHSPGHATHHYCHSPLYSIRPMFQAPRCAAALHERADPGPQPWDILKQDGGAVDPKMVTPLDGSHIVPLEHFGKEARFCALVVKAFATAAKTTHPTSRATAASAEAISPGSRVPGRASTAASATISTRR